MNQMQVDTNQIMAAARRGDKSALVSLVDHFYERIYAFLRRLAGNDPDAEDLTQKTFLQAFKALPSFAGRSSLNSWLHSIAYHSYVDHVRANHRGEIRSSEWWADLPSVDPRPDDLAGRADSARFLYRLVDQLDSEYRYAIHLHYYQGLTLQETADVTGVAVSTVKYRLKQGLTELERQLGREKSIHSSQ